MRERCVAEQRAAKARLGVAGLTPAEKSTADMYLEAHNNWKSQRGVPEDLDDVTALAPMHRASAVYVECYRKAGGGTLEGLRNLVDCLVASDVPADSPK